jgi:hypothetical protein
VLYLDLRWCGGLGYIYAFAGGDTRGFWRYDVAADTWENMGYAPDAVSAGGSLVWISTENVLYATQGKTDAFWRYFIENNTWDNSGLVAPPGIIERGGGLIWDGGNYLYTFKGGGSTTFYRYSLSNNVWDSLAPAPATIGAGGGLVYVDGYIYTVRGGGTTDFWRYCPVSDSWENLTPTPATVGTRSGRRLVRHGDYLYLPRGEVDEQFWRFKLEERWVSVEELLANPSAYDNKEVWVLGFISNVQRKMTPDNVYYSLFDITTYEETGAGVDNTQYYWSENVDVSGGELKLMRVSAGDHVVISEVYPDPVVAYDRTEFVELYNPTSSDISLEGYSLWEGGTQKIVFDSTHVMPAHGYLLVADGRYSDYKAQENADWPEPDATAAWALSNSGDSVILKDPNGNIVDQFGYATTDYYEGEPFPSTPAEGSSAERYSSSARDPAEDRGNAFDTDNNAYDFFEQLSPNPENSSFIEHPPAGGYELAGHLESAIYDAGVVVSWENISWVLTEPASTSIVVKVRTGDSSSIDDTWSVWTNVTNGQNIGENSRFIQYRVELSTTDDTSTPSLEELRIRYSVKGAVEEWVQTDWSGGGGLELWSAQQRLRVYYAWRHIDVSQGAGENSYGIFRGIFYASHEATGAPQLNMLGVKLFIDGKSVPTDTPQCWTLYEPWGAAGYIGFSSISRGWGWATYFAGELKGVREGALFAAFTTLEETFREYDAWFGISLGSLVGFVVGAITTVVLGPVGLGVLGWFAAAEAGFCIGTIAGFLIDYYDDGRDVAYYERDYDWDYAMDYDYGWDDYGWDYDAYYGMDGYDAGC